VPTRTAPAEVTNGPCGFVGTTVTISADTSRLAILAVTLKREPLATLSEAVFAVPSIASTGRALLGAVFMLTDTAAAVVVWSIVTLLEAASGRERGNSIVFHTSLATLLALALRIVFAGAGTDVLFNKLSESRGESGLLGLGRGVAGSR
jgi:hypothetical protein